jgi:hypothetical protein
MKATEVLKDRIIENHSVKFLIRDLLLNNLILLWLVNLSNFYSTFIKLKLSIQLKTTLHVLLSIDTIFGDN